MQVGRHRGRREERGRRHEQAGSSMTGGQKQGSRQWQEKKARREEQELRGLQVDREGGRNKQGVVDRQECMQAKTRSNTYVYCNCIFSWILINS
jgi:hypothetical protein